MNILDETYNFFIATDPYEFALFTALKRSSIEGRRSLAESILEGKSYKFPEVLTSRTSQVLRAYFKSLGVKMETKYAESEKLMTSEDMNVKKAFHIKGRIIYCTAYEELYLRKISKIIKRYNIDNPGQPMDINESWKYILKKMPMSVDELTDSLKELFIENIGILG